MRVPGKPGIKKPTTPGGRAKPVQKQPVEPGRKAKPGRKKPSPSKMPPELLERFKGKSAAKKKPPEKAKGKGVSAGGMKKRMSSKMKKK